MKKTTDACMARNRRAETRIQLSYEPSGNEAFIED